MARIPKDAKKVFSGVIFDVYQWEQELFDGSTTTFEGLKRPDTAIVVPITSDNKVLVINDEQPNRPAVMRFPGGRVDPGEDALEAAKRELLEELGYSGGSWELWHAAHPSGKVDYKISYFIAREVVKTADPAPEPGERITLHPMPIEVLLDKVISGEVDAYELEPVILRQIVQGKRAQLEAFLRENANS